MTDAFIQLNSGTSNFSAKTAAIWSIADILRGAFKPAEYQLCILPFMVLRRVEQALEATKPTVIEQADALRDLVTENDLDTILTDITGIPAYNTSAFDLASLLADPNNIDENLKHYLDGYSREVKSIIENFGLHDTLKKLKKNNLTYAIIQQFAGIDLHPDRVTNTEMGYLFEDLLRRFSEMVNETAGEHYTPRSVVQLCVRLAIAEDPRLAERAGQDITLYDPTCGTGGMLTAAEEYLAEHVPGSRGLVKAYGQELNDQSYAVAKADLLLKGQDPSNIQLGNTLSDDKFSHEHFTYGLANPPYGTNWKTDEAFVKNEAKTQGFAGRFGAGTPGVSDGSLLFVQHLISKMGQSGGRVAVVLNSSPLTNGDAGSGESEIRKWILENDWLEAVVRLPGDMFYNTGITTYIWVLSADKIESRRGKVQFIDASEMYSKMRKSLGDKRKEIEPEHIDLITSLYRAGVDASNSKIVPVEEFYFQKVTVDRPKRDEAGNVQVDRKGKPVTDSSLRDTERVPFGEDIDEYMAREVHPHVPDAVADKTKTKIGVQIPFDQYFYEPKALPSVESLEVELRESKTRIEAALTALMGDQ
jgi:type I restriction enzyme M protein